MPQLRSQTKSKPSGKWQTGKSPIATEKRNKQQVTYSELSSSGRSNSDSGSDGSSDCDSTDIDSEESGCPV
jgi:hypothetical protein